MLHISTLEFFVTLLCFRYTLILSVIPINGTVMVTEMAINRNKSDSLTVTVTEKNQ